MGWCTLEGKKIPAVLSVCKAYCSICKSAYTVSIMYNFICEKLYSELYSLSFFIASIVIRIMVITANGYWCQSYKYTAVLYSYGVSATAGQKPEVCVLPFFNCRQCSLVNYFLICSLLACCKLLSELTPGGIDALVRCILWTCKANPFSGHHAVVALFHCVWTTTSLL